MNLQVLPPAGTQARLGLTVTSDGHGEKIGAEIAMGRDLLALTLSQAAAIDRRLALGLEGAFAPTGTGKTAEAHARVGVDVGYQVSSLPGGFRVRGDVLAGIDAVNQAAPYVGGRVSAGALNKGLFARADGPVNGLYLQADRTLGAESRATIGANFSF